MKLQEITITEAYYLFNDEAVVYIQTDCRYPLESCNSLAIGKYCKDANLNMYESENASFLDIIHWLKERTKNTFKYFTFESNEFIVIDWYLYHHKK